MAAAPAMTNAQPTSRKRHSGRTSYLEDPASVVHRARSKQHGSSHPVGGRLHSVNSRGVFLSFRLRKFQKVVVLLG
jgi:hypothetical protein